MRFTRPLTVVGELLLVILDRGDLEPDCLGLMDKLRMCDCILGANEPCMHLSLLAAAMGAALQVERQPPPSLVLTSCPEIYYPWDRLNFGTTNSPLEFSSETSRMTKTAYLANTTSKPVHAAKGCVTPCKHCT